MRICRFNEQRIGLLQGEHLLDVTDAMPVAARDLTDGLEATLAGLAALGTDALSRLPRHALADVRLLAPVRRPGKIIGAPANYRAHIDEMAGRPLSAGHSADLEKAGLFLKASSSLVGPSEGIALRFPERVTHHEIELVAVIGREASQVGEDEALDVVAGYCLGLDITVRGPEERSLRKSIDSYTVAGPWLVTRDELPDPNAGLVMELQCNGQTRQRASTADMLFNVRYLIALASSFYTLQPGDLLFTGTPEGVDLIRPGDELLARCDGIGAMSVAVRAYPPRATTTRAAATA